MKSKDSRTWVLPPGGEESKEAIMEYVLNRSVALLIVEKPRHVSIGSSVCVKLHNRYFLATAAHNIEDVSSASQIRLLSRNMRGTGDAAVINFRASGKHDVAFLEIAEKYVMTSKIRSLELGDLKVRQRHDPYTAFMICGFPSAEATRYSNDVIEPVPLGLLTSSIDTQDDRDRLFLQYPPISKLDEGLELVEPFGLSGCGIWSFPPFAKNPIWTPSKSQLLAIASAWNKSRGYEIAEPVEYWLELISAEVPELTGEIQKALRGR